MASSFDALPPVESELLVATLSTDGEAAFRDAAWRRIFGGEADPWARLTEEDRGLAIRRAEEAAAGSATNQFFNVHAPDRDEPLPVFLNFLPVLLPALSRQGRTGGEEGHTVQAITVTGEVLALGEATTRAQMQRDRMETLGRMTMGIAHDFNNLLSSILGHTELIKSTYSGDVPALILSEYLRTIERAALDGAALVQKIQRYIRQEEQVRFEPLDLVGLIDDCLLLTKPYWYNEPRRRGISIDAKLVAQNSVPAVMGTAHELREVFVNLILNAVQAMPGGGLIRFDVDVEEERGVVVSVVDTGKGMPESVRRRIFEPLYTTRGEQGTGMGLAVSYSIIQKHNGSIVVDSEPGQGTRFTITIPPAKAETKEVAAEGTEEQRRAASVLVVDDEPRVRSVLAKLLSTRGHRVQQAASGAAALTLLDEAPGRYDVVFTDHGMPEMNGRQLAHTLRGRFPHLPIVLLTGDTEVGKPDEEVNVVLSKPFKLSDLDAVIQQLVSQ